MYKTILVPLDGSHRAESLLPHVEKLALEFKSKVIFIQVVEPLLHPAPGGPDGRHEYLIEYKKMKDDITAYLAGIQQGFTNVGIEASSVVEQGAVVETIISVAQKGKCGSDRYSQPWPEWVIPGILWKRGCRYYAKNRSTLIGYPNQKHVILH